MKRRVFQRVIASVLMSVAGSMAFAGGNDFVPNQALVRLAPGASIAAFNQLHGTTTIGSIPSRNIHKVQLSLNVDEQTFVSNLAGNPAVLTADLNFFGEDVDPNGSTQSFFLARSQPQYLADSTLNVHRVQQAQAVSRGQGVLVAVIDSGVDGTHPQLAGRLTTGVSFVEGSSTTGDIGPGPQTGHGTLVTGLITRVAPDVRVMPIRVMDGFGNTTTFRVTQGIYHAIDQGATVINLSLGTIADPQLIKDAIIEAIDRGVVVVAAAGNDDAQDPPRSPASLEALGVISVASTAPNGERSFFSNYGPWISLTAVGESAVSLVPGGGYGTAMGTSFAAPVVSGTVSLLRSRCPLLSVEAVRARIKATTINISNLNPSYPGQLGSGWLDAGRAVGATGPALDCQCDRTGDGQINIEDLYRWFQGPADLNGDGAANSEDAMELERLIRRQGAAGRGLR
jgi:thermitase